MRFARFTIFVFIICALGTGASPLWAQTQPPAQTAPNWERADLSQASKSKIPVRLQTGKNVPALKAGEGLQLEVLTHGLGHISALAMDKTGTLYVADREAGRVWRLRDRNQDGRFDTTQALPQRFDAPSGLAVSGQKVFVADRNAVWVMTGIEPPVKLAGLLNFGSKGVHHPLSVSADGQTLYLGLSTLKGEAELLSLDVESGEADLIQKTTSDQDIIDLASYGKGSPWVALEHGVGASLDSIVEISPSQTLTALALPISPSSGTDLSAALKNWPETLANHVLVSRQSSDGYDVLALPVELGQIDSRGKVIFSGFLSSSRRSAWGLPGPLFLDGNGLIIADSKNGDLYRLKAAPAPSVAPILSVSETPEDAGLITSFDTPAAGPTPIKDPPGMQVSTITQGSQIGSVSTLKRGSTLDVGSTIIRDYKPLSLDKEEADTEESEKEGDKSSRK